MNRKAEMELLPCPFCGGEAKLEQIGSARQSCIVACEDCSCRLESNEVFHQGNQWNTRAALRASAAPEEGMEIQDASEIVFLDAAGGQHRIVYDICEDRPGLGSGWFLHEDDPFALPSDSGKAAPDALIEKIATEAERYASHYPQSSDGRNTFIMFADFVRSLSPSPSVGTGTLNEWIDREFAGHGRAIRTKDEAGYSGEPYMSMADAKELTRRAVATFGGQ